MSSKQRNLRKKRPAEDDDAADDAAGDGDDSAQEVRQQLLHDLKLLQKQRRRAPGVDASKLVPAAAADDEDAAADNELMDAQYVKAVETNKSQILDETAHMEQFVERELARRLGKSVDGQGAQQLSRLEKQERELYEMPEGFETSLTKEVSLPGMMTAITEVEVSKEDKMRKIEESERIKHNMLLKKAGRSAEGPGGDAGMKVRRAEFAFSFGKQQGPKKMAGLDGAEVREARRFITERSIDPVEAAKKKARRQQ